MKTRKIIAGLVLAFSGIKISEGFVQKPLQGVSPSNSAFMPYNGAINGNKVNSPFTLKTKNSENLQNENPNEKNYPNNCILTKAQIKGVKQLKLSINQVQTPNFGSHTLNLINFLRRKGIKTNQEAFELAKEFNKTQALDIMTFYPTKNEVELNHKIELHTLLTILFLMKNGVSTAQEAFKKVKDLNEEQTLGIRKFGLSIEDVKIPKYGLHTLNAMKIFEDRGIEASLAFKMSKGLNEVEARGVSQFHLEKEQVIGLTIHQIRGIAYFNLKREQVMDSSFTSEILEAMISLRIYIPNAKSLELYETAMNLELFQIIGIIKFGLSLNQVGLEIWGDGFIPKDLKNIPLLELIHDLQSTILERNFKLNEKQKNRAKKLLDEILKDIKEGKTSLNTEPKSKLSRLGTPPKKTNSKTPPKKGKRNKGYKNDPKGGQNKRKL